MTDLLVLTDSEMKMIHERRAEADRERVQQYRAVHLLEVTARYARYLTDTGAALSFATFLDDFNYDGGDARVTYDGVVSLLECAWTVEL